MVKNIAFIISMCGGWFKHNCNCWRLLRESPSNFQFYFFSFSFLFIYFISFYFWTATTACLTDESMCKCVRVWISVRRTSTWINSRQFSMLCLSDMFENRVVFSSDDLLFVIYFDITTNDAIDTEMRFFATLKFTSIFTSINVGLVIQSFRYIKNRLNQMNRLSSLHRHIPLINHIVCLPTN